MNEHIATDTNSINPNCTYSELTSRIIKCAMAVHNYLGSGFHEVIYQRALSIEFQMQNLRFIRECEMPVFYHDIRIGSRRVDFLVEDKISVELKALLKLEAVHLAQAINYLEAFNLEIGLLLNFGAPSLEFKRLTNRKFKG